MPVLRKEKKKKNRGGIGEKIILNGTVSGIYKT